MTTQIINRFTGNVITEGEMNLRESVVHYVKAERTSDHVPDLRGSDLRGVKIRTTAVFTGLYKYLVMPVIAEDGIEYVRMGCHFRTVADWTTNFWNNPFEFPNNGDLKSKLQWLAYQTALAWLDLNREETTQEVKGNG